MRVEYAFVGAPGPDLSPAVAGAGAGSYVAEGAAIVAGGGGLRANEPSGMTTIFFNDGSVAETVDGAFGYSGFENWYSVPGGSVDTVADAENPSGSGIAIRHNWEALGGGVGHSGQAASYGGLGGPWDTMYWSFSMKYLSGGSFGSFGPKIFYFGDDGNDHWIYRGASGEIRVIPQGRSDLLSTSGGWVPIDTWVVVEFLVVSETVPGSSGDGIVRVWVDGELAGENTSVSWNGTPAFNFMQWYGHTDSGMSLDSEYRIGHLYVSGKN